MKYLLIVFLLIINLPQEKQKIDSTKAKVQKLLIYQQRPMKELDSIMVKLAKEDSVRKAENKK